MRSETIGSLEGPKGRNSIIGAQGELHPEAAWSRPEQSAEE